MVNEELVNYIQNERANGFTLDQLKGILIQNGYTPFEIDEAINQIIKSKNNTNNYRPAYPNPATNQGQNLNSQTQEINTQNQARLNQSIPGMQKIKHRNIFLVYLFMVITFGIYSIYWFVSTKKEINSLGAQIPTAWLLIVPIANFYWLYKYCEGFTQTIKKDSSPVVWFILAVFVGFILPGFVQSELNKLATN